ncbi:hypothetical protein BJ973_002952 [Actinoplanes tereljensis]|uniref:Uncharacterized protein n=1 Tax=Paractinoplanes tereljensis TaxID=571912 RepID=A0A919NPH1_9ACTN|nr:hypothetical protein [Actinoplanes tereljensis]GIF22630.1 hypothetical protein Ate02nite_53600 [Actinoplanes tereljensis]
MATVQLRNPTEGCAYFDRKKAAGKTSMEAMRALKRRLSDIVYRQMLNDATTATAPGSGGHQGTSTNSSVTGSHPHIGSSEKSLPEPADSKTITTILVIHGAGPRGETAWRQSCRTAGEVSKLVGDPLE